VVENSHDKIQKINFLLGLNEDDDSSEENS
jgi:hypothetical protein